MDFFPLSFLLHCDGIHFYLTVYIHICSAFHRIGMRRNNQQMVSLWPKQRKTVPQKNFSRGNQLLSFIKVEQRRTLNIWYFHVFILLLCNFGWITLCLFSLVLLCFFTVFFFFYIFYKTGKPKQRLSVSLDSEVPFYTEYIFCLSFGHLLKHP